MAEALKSFQEALEQTRQRATADPDNVELQRSLSVLQSKVGGAQLLSGQLPEAVHSCQTAIEIAERLAESDPDNVQAQRQKLSAQLDEYHKSLPKQLKHPDGEKQP